MEVAHRVNKSQQLGREKGSVHKDPELGMTMAMEGMPKVLKQREPGQRR